MYITIDHASQFRDQFHRAGRGDQFSYEALNMIYEYLEDVDPDYDLDVVALCCEYSEASYAEIAEMYEIEFSSVEDGHAIGELEQVVLYLNAEGAYIGTTEASTIVYQQF